MSLENLKYKRFKQRLQNYRDAVLFLQETIDTSAPQRIKEAATVKSYEMAFELAWKTLRDFLEYSGYQEVLSPREVIKKSFQQGYLSDGTLWIKMLDERNELTHVYSEEKSKDSAQLISEQYVRHLAELLHTLETK